MPKTNEQEVTKTASAVDLVAICMETTAIKVTTIKKSFVEQMRNLTYKDTVGGIKSATIECLGMARGLKETADSLVFRTLDGHLVRTAEINYREYLSMIVAKPLGMNSAESTVFVDKEIAKLPQLFTI